MKKNKIEKEGDEREKYTNGSNVSERKLEKAKKINIYRESDRDRQSGKDKYKEKGEERNK